MKLLTIKMYQLPTIKRQADFVTVFMEHTNIPWHTVSTPSHTPLCRHVLTLLPLINMCPSSQSKIHFSPKPSRQETTRPLVGASSNPHVTSRKRIEIYDRCLLYCTRYSK